MAIRVRAIRRYDCETEAERDLVWGPDALIYTEDTDKYWKIIDGDFEEVQESEIRFTSPIPFEKILISGVATENSFVKSDGSHAEPEDGGGGSGHEIQEGGTPMATEPALNFSSTDFDVSDNPAVSTDVALKAAYVTKLGHISVTQAVDLDLIETRVNELDAAIVLKGTWDASAGTFPGASVAQAGWSYIVSIGGTVDGQVFNVNDRLIAILDNASTTTFAANWFKADYTDLVTALDGQTGNITLGAVINSLAAKATLVDADFVPAMDSADSNASKKWSFLNIKANLKTYFDTLYQVILTAANFGDFIIALTGKTTPVDADSIIVSDSAASDDSKKVSLTNFKAFLKTYFDSLYTNVSAVVRPAIFDGQGGIVLVGTKTLIRVKQSCTPTAWSIAAYGSSINLTLDIKRIASGTALPSASIVASDPPDLTTGNAVKSTSMVAWSPTTLTADDILEVSVLTNTGATYITFDIYS